MSPRDEFPMSRVDSTGRSAPTSTEAVEQRQQLDEAERREPPPWTWLVGGPNYNALGDG
jgi:hypothetical protein